MYVVTAYRSLAPHAAAVLLHSAITDLARPIILQHPLALPYHRTKFTSDPAGGCDEVGEQNMGISGHIHRRQKHRTL